MVPMCGRGNWNCFFFFLTSFWGEPSEKGIGRTTFFLITFSYSIYTTPLVIFAFKFQCTSSLCVPEKEQKKWPSMTDVKLRKMLFFLFVCVCVVCRCNETLSEPSSHTTQDHITVCFVTPPSSIFFFGLTQSRLFFFFPYGPYGPLNELPWCVSFSLIFWLYMPATVIFSVCVSSVFHYIT
jgi:hypothetical protein